MVDGHGVGRFEFGRLIEGYVVDNEMVMNSYIGSSLIGMYAKCGDLVSPFRGKTPPALETRKYLTRTLGYDGKKKQGEFVSGLASAATSSNGSDFPSKSPMSSNALIILRFDRTLPTVIWTTAFKLLVVMTPTVLVSPATALISPTEFPV
ncbi:hypothetical protein L6452_18562 [Arctium lappa]|uniref:Uncharacterized protein n=1 Tax=Arctium lappa TaxID=4217 RepID=A0ACB9C6R0_ARCLA|nr:hypothetical protein L6452_18562 [Arctium lappa]